MPPLNSAFFLVYDPMHQVKSQSKLSYLVKKLLECVTSLLLSYPVNGLLKLLKLELPILGILLLHFPFNMAFLVNYSIFNEHGEKYQNFKRKKKLGLCIKTKIQQSALMS